MSAGKRSIATTEHIAIIGAGIGGLAAARALALHGYQITVFEQAEELTEVGAGLQIGPNGIAVMEALGLREVAEPFASIPEAVELHNQAGRKIALIPMGEAATQRYGRPYWQFHRADLIEILARDLPDNVHLKLNSHIIGVEQDADAVTILRMDGKSQFDAVIAADGVNSKTRRSVLGGGAARFTGQTAWRALVPAENVPKSFARDTAQVYMGPGRHLVTYPLRNGSLINLVAVQERAYWRHEGWNHHGDPETLRIAFARFGGQVPGLLEAVDDCILWGLFGHPRLQQWSKGRVAVLGDAAHPMLPYLAQGAVMALEDAWVLAKSLVEADDVQSGLQTYWMQRIDRATRVQEAARTNAWAYHLRTPGFTQIAHLGLRAISAIRPQRLLTRFDWLYGGDVTQAD